MTTLTTIRHLLNIALVFVSVVAPAFSLQQRVRWGAVTEVNNCLTFVNEFDKMSLSRSNKIWKVISRIFVYIVKFLWTLPSVFPCSSTSCVVRSVASYI